MPKIKLLLAYDGTKYGGWQIQPNTVTIQEVLQEQLKIILRAETAVTGAGRTDAGVHALGQVAHFSTALDVDLFKLKASLNGLLPHDIRVKNVECVPEHFHARYSACNKIYQYHLHLAPVLDPFTSLYRWQVGEIDQDALRQAADHLLGTHDFTSFANEPGSGAAAKNPIRSIKRIELIPQREGLILEFEGASFLYKMVRNMTGTLIETARGKRPADQILDILHAKDRRKAGRAAPAKGLFLVRVDYPQDLSERKSG